MLPQVLALSPPSQITITNDKGRLSKEEIERIVNGSSTSAHSYPALSCRLTHPPLAQRPSVTRPRTKLRPLASPPRTVSRRKLFSQARRQGASNVNDSSPIGTPTTFATRPTPTSRTSSPPPTRMRCKRPSPRQSRGSTPRPRRAGRSTRRSRRSWRASRTRLYAEGVRRGRGAGGGGGRVPWGRRRGGCRG